VPVSTAHRSHYSQTAIQRNAGVPQPGTSLRLRYNRSITARFPEDDNLFTHELISAFPAQLRADGRTAITISVSRSAAPNRTDRDSPFSAR
jgi:hypothetical protein